MLHAYRVDSDELRDPTTDLCDTTSHYIERDHTQVNRPSES